MVEPSFVEVRVFQPTIFQKQLPYVWYLCISGTTTVAYNVLTSSLLQSYWCKKDVTKKVK